MAALTKPIVYLSMSFVLFMIAPALISIGTMSGPRLYLWLGLAALGVAGLIPPVQRLVSRLTAQRGAEPDADSAD